MAKKPSKAVALGAPSTGLKKGALDAPSGGLSAGRELAQHQKPNVKQDEGPRHINVTLKKFGSLRLLCKPAIVIKMLKAEHDGVPFAVDDEEGEAAPAAAAAAPPRVKAECGVPFALQVKKEEAVDAAAMPARGGVAWSMADTTSSAAPSWPSSSAAVGRKRKAVVAVSVDLTHDGSDIPAVSIDLTHDGSGAKEMP